MILTQENGSTWRKTCQAVILSVTNPTRSGLESNPGLHGERLVTNCLCRVTAVQLLRDTLQSTFSGKTGA